MSRHDIPPLQAEPLTPDERAWADRLRRIGPHAGPSPELDAKILAAAQAAVARRPQRAAAPRRWPALLGAAASLVIVVGMAWQLQPLLRSRPSLGEAPPNAPMPTSEGSLSADVLAAANPLARTAVDNPPAAPGPAAPPPTPRRSIRVPPPLPSVADQSAASPGAQPAPKFGDDAIPTYSGYAGRTPAPPSASKAAANDATTDASPDERRERDAGASPEAFPAPSADAAMSADAAPAPATRTVDQAHEASSRERTASRQQTQSAPPAEGDTVRRIEASGSSNVHGNVPASDDALLEPAAWLQRIRDRRDAGDLVGARESLALFRESHPRMRLPADLARLDD